MISDTISKIYDTRFAFVCQAPFPKKDRFFCGRGERWVEFGGLGLWVYLGGYGVFHRIRRKQFSVKIVFAAFPYEGKALAVPRWFFCG